MKIIHLLAAIIVLVFCKCEPSRPPKPFVRPEPEKIFISFLTDFDISHVDSIGITISTGDTGKSNEVVNHKIMSKHYDENQRLWRFDLHITDSLWVDMNYIFSFQKDSLFKQYLLSDIELGKWGTYTEEQPDAYSWEISTYKLDGKLFEDSDVYLTSEKIFRDLHSWQRK